MGFTHSLGVRRQEASLYSIATVNCLISVRDVPSAAAVTLNLCVSDASAVCSSVVSEHSSCPTPPSPQSLMGEPLLFVSAAH